MKILPVICFTLLLYNLTAQNVIDLINIPSKPAGLYYVNNKDSQNLLRIDLTTVYSNQAESGVHYGAGTGQKSFDKYIPGKTSKIKISELQPVFYLYLENNPIINEDNWLFSAAKSPDDFIIIKLKKKHNDREFTVGRDNNFGGWAGSKSGIQEKDIIEFEYKVLKESIYLISINNTLEDGDYCFIYYGEVLHKYLNNKVLDFNISFSK